MSLAHRDIKPANLLLAPGFDTVKLIDFGTTKYVKTKTSTIVGTIKYMAIDVRTQSDPAGYDPYAADMWSMGCLLYGMVTGKLAFDGRNQDEISDKIKDKLVTNYDNEKKKLTPKQRREQACQSNGGTTVYIPKEDWPSLTEKY